MEPRARTGIMASTVCALFAAVISCAVLAASAPSAVPPAEAPSMGTITWSCDFEGTYCGMAEQSKIEPERRSQFVSEARNGTKALRLTTLPGDDQVHGSGRWERNDLELAPSPDYCNEGQEEWWSLSVLFPDDFVVPKGGGVAMDFHDNADGGQPNMNLVIRPTGLILYGFYGDVKEPDEYRKDLGAVQRNKWYDFVFHMRWSSKDDGYMVAWLDGRKVLVHHGPTLYRGISCYFKLANYHSPTRESSILFDRVIRGTSADVVALTKLQD